MRLSLLLASLLLAPLAAQAAQPDTPLTHKLREVARNSNIGTPRAINADIMDEGYSVEGSRLINHLRVRPQHALQMRSNPDMVRQQLASSVCRNPGFRQLLAEGAMLVYDFTELGNTKRMVTIEYFRAEDCRNR